MIVVLVACAKRKHTLPVAARDLYRGRLFRAARRYAERQGDWWFILSAKHGLVEPATVLEPYDLSLDELTARERRAWGRAIVDRLNVGRGDYAVMLAGRRYVDPIAPLLEGRGVHVLTPLAGMASGERYRWFLRDYGDANAKAARSA